MWNQTNGSSQTHRETVLQIQTNIQGEIIGMIETEAEEETVEIPTVIKEIGIGTGTGIGIIGQEVREDNNFVHNLLANFFFLFLLKGFRDSQNNQGGNSFYQNQNGYQSRNERNNEYSGKGNTEFSRDNNFKERGERGDYNRENRDGYRGGGGFKGGNGNRDNRASNVKGPLDRNDRQGQGKYKKKKNYSILKCDET